MVIEGCLSRKHQHHRGTTRKN